MITKSKYFRSDIEGLRAIAILLVIGAHFTLPGLSAGFIGVDIFFVISGYLITSILVRELNNNKKINLPRFYSNRLRRLFPALATMLVVSCIAAYYILPDLQSLVQSKAAATASVWISNIYFTFADADYFAAETTTNAFLHTWSLGVEEQFYLVWPLLLLLCFNLVAENKKYSSLAITLIFVAACSACACFLLAQTWPIFSFYMMPTRAWQFAAGALTWLLVERYKASSKHTGLIGVIGLALLFSSLHFIDAQTVYPSTLALLPTLATCAWLLAGSNPQSYTHKLLSLAPMQWMGRLSYAWYLWHWPVLILGEHLIPISGSYNNTILAIGISLLLAIFTHHLIENPIRFGRAKQLLPRWQIIIALSAMTLLSTQFLHWNSNALERIASSPINVQIVKGIGDTPSFYKDGCDEWYSSDELKPCRYGSESASKTAVLLGDSIGAQWFPTLERLYAADDWTIIVLTKSSCPIVDEPFFYKRIGREYTECSNWRSKAIEWLQSKEIDALYIGSVASTPYSDEQWKNGTLRILEKLQNIPKVFLIESNPTLGFNGPHCLAEHHNESSSYCNTQLADQTEYEHVAGILRKVTETTSNAHWIETASFVCPNKKCSAARDGIIVFRDSQHLTASFTALAAQHFSQQINDYEKNK